MSRSKMRLAEANLSAVKYAPESSTMPDFVERRVTERRVCWGCWLIHCWQRNCQIYIFLRKTRCGGVHQDPEPRHHRLRWNTCLYLL